MKEVTIKIPEKKYNFFIELMNELGLEVSQKYDVPEEHISLVKDRMNQIEPNIIEWEEAKKRLNLDS